VILARRAVKADGHYQAAGVRKHTYLGASHGLYYFGRKLQCCHMQLAAALRSDVT
jgi:hypothetical protein